MTEIHTPPENGKPTNEPFITVCQCGSVAYGVKKRSKTAITIECRECGLVSSVKGNIAPVRVESGEIAFAVKEKIIKPDPEAGKKKEPEDDEKSPTLADQRYRTLRFRITESQDEIAKKALELVRILNFGNEAYRASQWQGSALEAVCADFISGVDPIALQIYDAMQEAVNIEIEMYKEKHPDREMPARKVREAKARVREEMTKKLEIWVEEKYEQHQSQDEAVSLEEYRAANEKKNHEKEEEDRVEDNGLMFQGIAEGLVEHSDDVVAQGGTRPAFLCAPPERWNEVRQRWERDGGVMLHLFGDERTMTGSGQTPNMYLWSKSVDDIPDRLDLLYDDIMNKAIPWAELIVVEYIKEGQEPSGLTDKIEVKK